MKHSLFVNPGSNAPAVLPEWLPNSARNYIEHTTFGRSMRVVAETKGTHPSTILRHVRRIEERRDDPLVDAALDAFAHDISLPTTKVAKEPNSMLNTIDRPKIARDGEVEIEAKRILRRLCENSAFLIIAKGMEKAAVMRETNQRKPIRIAVVDCHIAEAFALKDWIECVSSGKIRSYTITHVGKSALKRLLAQDRLRSGEKTSKSCGIDQENMVEKQSAVGVDTRPKRIKYNLAESPVAVLGRRRNRDGQPFLTDDLVVASDQLREDFELAQMGARVTQNWDRFLTSGRGGFAGGDGPAEGPRQARERVALALKALGPGLGDIALRCCCYLEGMETAEKRMGWSARSGKIVLRIALQRLKQHYDGATEP